MGKDIEEYAVKVRELRGGKDEKIRIEDYCVEKSPKEVKNADIDENSLNLGEDKTGNRKLITATEVDKNANKSDIHSENTKTNETDVAKEDVFKQEENDELKAGEDKTKVEEEAKLKNEEEERKRVEEELKIKAEEENFKALEAERLKVEEEKKQEEAEKEAK